MATKEFAQVLLNPQLFEDKEVTTNIPDPQTEDDESDDDMTEAIAEAEESDVFDPVVYLEENPDVAAAVQRGETTAVDHFRQYGRFEGRTFNSFFSVSIYQQQNPDVAAQVQTGQTNVFDHFWQYGRFEGREFSSFFSIKAYLEKNQDVAAAVQRGETTAFDHFRQYGRLEGRECSDLFSGKKYLEMNQDVAAAVQRGETTAFDHFRQYGRFEGREFSSFFSVKAYLEKNSDVAAAVERGETTAVDHFWEYGRFEGREISFSFSISQITSIFSVTSFSEISFSSLSEFFNSSEGQDLLLGSGEDDLTGGETTAETSGETTTAETSGETNTANTTTEDPLIVQIPNFPNTESTNGSTTDGGGDSTNGSTPDDGIEPAIPEPSATLDISFIVETYREQLQAQFPDFDFENLTGTQALQIQQYAEAQQLNPSAFVDASFVTSTVSVLLQSRGINITGLTQQEIIEKGLEEGISPCPTIDLSFFREEYAAQLLKFFKVESIEEISNQELFDFISGEGLELGLSTSAFFSLEYYRETLAAELVEFFSVSSIEEVTNQQIFQFANGEGLEQGLNPSQFVRLNFYKAVYAEQLKEFFGVESVDEISNVQLIGFIATTGIEQGLNPSPAIAFNYIKAVYGEELTAALGENPTFQQILNFISTEGLDMGLNPSAFVNLAYSEKRYREDIRAAKDLFGKAEGTNTLKEIKDLSEEELDAAVGKLSKEDVLESLVVDSGPMVDVKFYRWEYAEELKTFYGLATVDEVANLSEEQVISFACGEGKDMGLSLSPFDAKGYLAVEANARSLMDFFGVEDVAELTEQQIYQFALGEGLKMGLSVATFLNIEYYSGTYAAALTATFGDGYTNEQVVDFVFGNAKPFVDVKYYIQANADAIATLAASLGKEVSALTDEEIITYALTEGFDGSAKLCALDIDAYAAEYGTELVAFYEVEDATKLSQEQVYKFMVGEGWKLGIGLVDFVAAADVQFYRDLNAEALTELYGVDAAELSAEVVLDYQFGGLSQYIDYDYLRFSMSEELLAFYADAGVTDVADLTNLQILDYTYSEMFVSEEFSIGMLSAVGVEGYLEAGGAELEQALKDYFQVEDLKSLDQKAIQEFMLTVGVEQGFAVEGFVDVEYIRETFAAAIATPELIAAWASTNTVDIGYVRYQISQLIEAGTVTVETLKAQSLVGEDVEDLADLSDADLCGLTQNTDFQALLGDGASIQLSVSDNVDYLRETYSAAIAYVQNISLEAVAALSNEEILAWASDSAADVGFIRYQVIQALENQYLTLDQVKTYLGVEIEDISDLTDTQIVELAFNSEFIGGLPEGEGIMPGAVDTAGFAAVEANATELKAFFEVEDVAELTQAQVREFMFGAAVEKGLSLEGFVKFDYLQSTYVSAIVGTDEAVFGWLAKGAEKLDVEFLRYEIKQLESDQLTSLLGELNIDVTDVEMLDTKQVISIAYSAEFKNLLGGEKLQLGAIALDGYREKYAAELTEFFAKKDESITNGEDTTDGEGIIPGEDISDGEGIIPGEDITDGEDTTDGAEDFDVATIKDKDLVKFMFGKGWKMGLNPVEFVSVDYLREEFADKIAKHYQISSEAVAELKDELIIGGIYGGLADQIDIDFCRKANKDKLTAKFGKAIEQITDVEILEYAYTDGLVEGMSLSEADLLDVEGYLGEYGDQVAAEFGVEVDKVATLDVAKILEFAKGKGLKLGLDLASFADMDSFRQTFAADIAFNYRLEQVYNLTAESTFSYMVTGGIDAGLDASPAIDLEWYETNYAAELETDKAIADLDNNGAIDNAELYDYVTGVGLEKGLNPSDLIDFEAFRAEGSASAQDLLTFYEATSLEEVSYSETLEYMLSAGLEVGHLPSDKVDLEGYIATNTDRLIQHYGVAAIDRVSKVDAFNYMFGSGLEMAI